jgi:lipopolysaccharide/colanic/teichoic acid biosynthesis glycosyltransferase
LGGVAERLSIVVEKVMNYTAVTKPLLDRFAALLILLVSLPIVIPVILMLAISTRGNVWFRQPRPGYKQKIFHIIKFKTMTDEVDEKGILKSDEARLTPLGRFIRKTSLDELPQLINVLKGDMSIIGPRPLLVEYIPLYDLQQARRHDVKPGITGWAQVNGRNAISWREKFSLDLWYVDNISFWVDVKIFVLTMIKVIRLEGISSETSATMEHFRGN